MSQQSQQRYSAEEALAYMMSDTESSSEEEFELTSSYSSESSYEPPVDVLEGLQWPAPVTPAPVTPAPVTPAPVTPAGFLEELVASMVEQTNLYAGQFIETHPNSYYARPQIWTPTNPCELKKFWGILLSMGLVKKPTIRSYWVSDILYATPMYATIMSRTRFEVLLKFLHFNNNSLCPPAGSADYDRLYKLRPVVSHLNQRFSQLFTPDKELSIDESLVHFKGRLHFKQYLPSKRARYGVKLYKLCDSGTGYTQKFRIYEGRDSIINPPECPPTLTLTGKIVWELLHPFLDKGYHLYLDNFYTSVALFNCLLSRGTVACGTIRRNQKQLPKTFVEHPVRKGESRAVCSNNLLLIKYKDKRDVFVLSSIHPDRSSPVAVRGSTVPAIKPVAIQDYNKFMGGVDLSDQVLQPYNALRKSRAWYKKIVLHLIQTI
ncbi:piggyBac transposable element-derived protein 4-like [Dendropsophus ebraccatus]|uniref:piggyBac transposable element-derived protein 4-like n=1 Tax=Dendropsophus ebraccatus TaxID=150705 RepID=UPI003831EC03